MQSATAPATQPAPIIHLSRSERNQYSISRAILASCEREQGRRFNNFETDISDELSRHLPRTLPRRGGLLIPTDVQFRVGLDTKGAAKGQELIYTAPGTFIDALRNKTSVLALGATMVTGLRDKIAFPRETASAAATWVAENSGTDVADSNLTLDQVPASPKTLMGTTSFSCELLVQSTPQVDALVQNDLAQISAAAVDRAALHGAGGPVEPIGLYNLPNVNAVAMAGAITFNKVVALETAIAVANGEVDESTKAYVTTPEIREKAKLTSELTGSSLRVWRDGQMNDCVAQATNQVRKDLGVGTNEHGILFGCWSECLFCGWGALEIITDPYRLKKQGMIEVTSVLFADVVFRHTQAFAKGTGLTAT